MYAYVELVCVAYHAFVGKTKAASRASHKRIRTQCMSMRVATSAICTVRTYCTSPDWKAIPKSEKIFVQKLSGFDCVIGNTSASATNGELNGEVTKTSIFRPNPRCNCPYKKRFRNDVPRTFVKSNNLVHPWNLCVSTIYNHLQVDVYVARRLFYE